MDGKIEVFIQNDLFSHGTGLFIYMKNEKTGRIYQCKPMDMVFEDITESDQTYVEPTLKFKYKMGQDFLKGLAQALIDSGYRDKSISKDGEIKRMTDHLDDMRKIAFKFIDEAPSNKGV